MNSKELSTIEEFKKIKPYLNKWGQYVDESLMQLLSPLNLENCIKITPKFRLKTDKSYLTKALYRDKQYENPLLDIEDKVGTRIVLLKSSDLAKVGEIILKATHWEAKTTKNIEVLIDENPRSFDYQSIHIVVWPKKDNSDYLDVEDLVKCEVQIRTLLQHAYAEISHDSIYKGPYKNDKEIIRHLSKAMALMEATDDYFCKVFEIMTDQNRKYRNYLNELTRLYKQFDDKFSNDQINIESTDLVFELLSYKDVDISSIEEYIIRDNANLRTILKDKNGFLFTQPIILLVLYFFTTHRSILRKYWPLSNESLQNIYTVMGVSYDLY